MAEPHLFSHYFFQLDKISATSKIPDAFFGSDHCCKMTAVADLGDADNFIFFPEN